MVYRGEGGGVQRGGRWRVGKWCTEGGGYRG